MSGRGSERIDGVKDDGLVCEKSGEKISYEDTGTEILFADSEAWLGCDCKVCAAYRAGFDVGYKQGNYDFS